MPPTTPAAIPLQFGCFLAPHHPTGENPVLQFQRDLKLVKHLDIDGLHRWHNVWTLGRPGAEHVDDKWDLLERTAGGAATGTGTSVIGTPDQLVAAIHNLQEVTGGFGVVMGFAHDWANRKNTMRSWGLFARYVIPELRGMTIGLSESQEYLNASRVELMGGAGRAIMAKVMENERAAEAMQITANGWPSAPRPANRANSAPEAASPKRDQSSLRATALGVTFILGSYSASSITRPSVRNWSRSWVRHDSHGP